MKGMSERALELFGELCELEPALLANRLQEIGRERPDLRAALEELLRADQLSDPGLERGPVVPGELVAALAAGGALVSDRATFGSRSPEMAGQRIGSFTLIRRIGRGGMGVVWEAEQDHPRRRVALKVMRAGFTSAEARHRFRHEVEFLGRLQHPSIAHVYAAGTIELEGEDMPYFAMELIQEARTLDEHLRERQPDLPERVRLFALICDAVHHGHQRGVIHRDLKPSNVLLGPDGIPKVIDFGVARATDLDVMLTTQYAGAGELVGTLAYMSPEQCDADPAGLDLRSDVYSLGVMLYELLCGRPPYSLNGLTILAAATIIRTRESERAGMIDRRLRGDLEAVILKAMDKDRRRRYSSAAALAEDLRRWLRGDPVEVRGPSSWRTTTAWIARHPIVATASACVLLLAVSAVSMYVMAHFLAAEPVRLEVDDSFQTATLFSRAGLEIEHWNAGQGKIVFGVLIERSDEHGEGKVVALAFNVNTPVALPGSGELCLFDALNPKHPYWSSREEPLVPPGEGPSQANGRYGVTSGVVAEVFETSPGPELVVLHRNHPYDATAIRIYDCRGRVRFETWHFGGLNQLHWMAGAHILVVGGVNSEARWDELGHPMIGSKALYPAVVLAIEPRDGHVNNRFYLAYQGRLRDPTIRWYKWLGPPEKLAPLQTLVGYASAPQGNWNSGEYAEITFMPDATAEMEPSPSLALIVDAMGREVDRIVYDSYKRWELEGVLPHASSYHLFEYADLRAR